MFGTHVSILHLYNSVTLDWNVHSALLLTVRDQPTAEYQILQDFLVFIVSGGLEYVPGIVTPIPGSPQLHWISF